MLVDNGSWDLVDLAHWNINYHARNNGAETTRFGTWEIISLPVDLNVDCASEEEGEGSCILIQSSH